MSIKDDRTKYEKELMSKANVIGVMTARKIQKGVVTDTMAITCMVSTKKSFVELKSEDYIPRSVGSTPTDVIEVGKVKALGLIDALADLGVNRRTRIRPAPMGTSGGHFKVTAGTNGELLYVNGGTICIGTNNHVAAMSNNAKIGDPYLQPGPADKGKVPDDIIGYLYKYEPISFFGVPSKCTISGTIVSILNYCAKHLGRKTRLASYYVSNAPNLVDAAAVILINDNDVLARILDIGLPSGKRTAEIDMLVQKSGRTTKHTSNAKITSIDATINVGYGGSKMATFTDQIIISKPGFSAGGDSGSLILDMDNYAVGKLFAGSDQITIANHIDNYLDALNAEIVLAAGSVENETRTPR